MSCIPSVLVRSAGTVSRALHGRALLWGRASGAVRLLARGLANQGTYTYRNYYGHVMEADLSDYAERIGFFGAHSSRLMRYVTSQLCPGDWTIDAGANVGLFTSAMCAAVGPKGRVWAVEPLPRNVQRLEAMREANQLPQLDILPIALAFEAATAKLRLPARRGGSGWASFVATRERSGHIEVPTASLDELVDSRDPGRPLRLVKIDVEGFEGEVLDGAKRTLAARRPHVICEFHDPLLRAAGTSAAKLLGRFEKLGYVARHPYGRAPNSLDGIITDLVLVPE